MPSLKDAYLLQNRADEVFAELKSVHDGYVTREKEASGMELQSPILIPPKSGVSVGNLWVHSTPIPNRFRVLVRELANVLKSVLDYLVGELILLDSGSEYPRARIPIEDSPEKFDGRRPGKGRSSYLEGLTDIHVAAIERLQPYNGCDWTRHLRDLANPSRHRRLTVCAQQSVLGVRQVDTTETIDGIPVVKMYLDLSPFIALPDGTPIVKTLEIVKSQVAQTLDAFNPEF